MENIGTGEGLVNIHVTYKGAVAEFGQRAINDVMREAYYKAGVFWHKEFLPGHFTRDAFRKYGNVYKPRSGETKGAGSKAFWRSYSGQKKKTLGHTNPLVLSGELRGACRARRVVAKATRNKVGVRVILPMAQKANLRHPDSQINMRDELTAVSQPEVEILAEVINREIAAGLKRLQTQTSKTIR